jgi:hypothetical protein
VFKGDTVRIPFFGSYTPTGKIVPASAGLEFPTIDWAALESAAWAFGLAYWKQDAAAFLAAFDDIVRAVGLPVPLRGPLTAGAVNWGVVAVDVMGLIVAVSMKNPEAIIAAVMKLASDLGLKLA